MIAPDDFERRMNSSTVPPRFADELIRPFVAVTIAAITLVQLVERPPAEFGGLVGVLTLVVIAACVTPALPRPVLPEKHLLVLLLTTAIVGPVLAVFAPHTVAIAFVFLNSAVAGERLAARRAAFAVAAVATTGAVVAALYLPPALHLDPGPPWWTALAVGFPLSVGLGRKDRATAVAMAEYAAGESRRAAALEERGRIAREIHDVLGHALSGITMQLDMADALFSAGRDDEGNKAVRRARTLAAAGMGETRRAVHALREDTLPLPETIARMAEAAGARCEVRGEMGTLRVETTQTVIRTAQEAITNAHRHAPGGAVRLLLELGDETVRLVVTDSGPADDAVPGAAVGSGMGLVGMRERVGLAGGTLYAGPDGEHGWVVRLELPR
jgi:signal transduction histidine kinase